MPECGLSLGSCLGDRLAFLRQARDAIAKLPGTRVLAQSPVYETEPVGMKPEYAHLRFLNAVMIIETDWPPERLRAELSSIEDAAGRDRNDDKYAPRTLDIDLIYYGSEMRPGPSLAIPHPRWAERRFVVQPLADLRPDLILPGSNISVREQLARLPEKPAVCLYAKDW